MTALRVRKNASLRGRNTFGVEARAARLIEVRTEDALRKALTREDVRRGPLLVLGEGSNILFAGDVDATVLCIAMAQVAIVEDGMASVHVRAEAGADWDALVRWTLEHGLEGLENLALIPGTVGAAPIQNIGAYGVEVGEFIASVEAFDRESGTMRTLEVAECGFAYRDSLFKREPLRWIVTAVTFSLPRRHTLRVDYSGVREELVAMQIERPTASDVANAVTRLRQRKLPDPRTIGNAGSFFKNPLVATEVAVALKAKHTALPTFATADAALNKLSAAWMIEACGWKGWHQPQSATGDAGVSAQHALVLVNYGSATGAQLLDLAQQIMASVQKHFGVQLEPEPRIIGLP
ncbi:MAG: UDP-N-acetylmuramate dehydrogenase [Lysobacteraceae bacterium]